MKEINKNEKTAKKSLTLKEQKFVEAMANPKTKSATEAAIKAGYSSRTARVQASQNLTKLNISEAIQKRRERAIRHYHVTPEELIGSAVFQMRSSMNDLIDEEGYFDLEKARETGAIDLVKEMEVITNVDLQTMNKTVRHKIKFESPAAARKELADYLGIKQLPRINDADLTKLIATWKRLAAKFGTTFEEEMRVYLDQYATPEMRERLSNPDLQAQIISEANN